MCTNERRSPYGLCPKRPVGPFGSLSAIISQYRLSLGGRLPECVRLYEMPCKHHKDPILRNYQEQGSEIPSRAFWDDARRALLFIRISILLNVDALAGIVLEGRHGPFGSLVLWICQAEMFGKTKKFLLRPNLRLNSHKMFNISGNIKPI